jgi:predicted acetyltransferase
MPCHASHRARKPLAATHTSAYNGPVSDLDLYAASAEGFPRLCRMVALAFGDEPLDASVDAEQPLFEPERSLVARRGGEEVGCTWIYSLTMRVPGGDMHAAGVTGVGVSPVHRRQGVLTALMGRQLRDVYERGTEPLAALWASEPQIYGRFGYGLAAPRAAVRLATRQTQLPPERHGDVRLRFVEPVASQLSAAYEAARPMRAGMLSRGEDWWRFRLSDLPETRQGAVGLVAVLAETDVAEGYALYRTKPRWDPEGPAGEVRIQEIITSTPRAAEALWRFVIGLDLMSELDAWSLPPDDPLLYLVDNPRRLGMTIRDGLYVRLVDLPRAVAERTYAAAAAVTVEVVDDVCPWNGGRYRFDLSPEGATCTKTTATADLALSATELAAAYLGGPTLAALAAAGRVDEHTPSTVAALSRAWVGDVAPWSPETF